ncbi:cyclin-like protein [Cadophora sp. MPI-SDFR-AT-0126]|nr:cyclin-like protein [Leotiomycetes sp. MPI-SDFR-AT-0126]
MPIPNASRTATVPCPNQHQDSNSVEPCDSGRFTALAGTQDKITARLRSEIMVNELSKNTFDEYLEDIMKHMRLMEDLTRPVVDSIDIQPELRWFMRPYLLDFLIEAHHAFQLLPGTLFLAINLLDRYCSRREVFKRHYQLVGCASLLVAAKYGERKGRVPLMKELEKMCCSLFEEQMFIEMDISHPTVDSFLQIALTEGNYGVEVEHMARYICEVALCHKDFVSTKPSIIARASLALAKSILGSRETLILDQTEIFTTVALSQYLQGISRILMRKYSPPHFSCSSIRLEHILAQQAAIGRGIVGPPTLPCEIPQEPGHDSDCGHSSQKTSDCVANGYPTPQITPAGDMSLE